MQPIFLSERDLQLIVVDQDPNEVASRGTGVVAAELMLNQRNRLIVGVDKLLARLHEEHPEGLPQSLRGVCTEVDGLLTQLSQASFLPEDQEQRKSFGPT
jgi:hypothetical protein